jgi:hypothetical protein
MRKYVIALAALAFVMVTGAAQAQTAQGLLRQAKILNGMCRGSMDDWEQQKAVCCGRAQVFVRLNQLGWCYGKRGQYGAQMEWHRCTSRSHRNTPADDFCEDDTQATRSRPRYDLPHGLLFPPR